MSRVVQLCCAQVIGLFPQAGSSGEADLWMTLECWCAAITLKRDGRVLIFRLPDAMGMAPELNRRMVMWTESLRL